MPSSAAVEIQNLKLTFNSKTVLEGFSLAVAEAETVVLAGPSGCGKSSILLCLLGFLTPESGAISLQGTPLTPETVWAIRRQVAYVPQEPDLGTGSVQQWLDQMLSFQANTGVSGELLTGRLHAVGLTETLLEQPAEKLSGGEKQRVALATALLLQRPILLLDEPTSALDPSSRDKVYHLLRQLTETTVLMISHDEHPRLDFADRIVQLLPEGAAHGSH